MTDHLRTLSAGFSSDPAEVTDLEYAIDQGFIAVTDEAQNDLESNSLGICPGFLHETHYDLTMPS